MVISTMKEELTATTSVPASSTETSSGAVSYILIRKMHTSLWENKMAQ
jgi:hypothetical protein